MCTIGRFCGRLWRAEKAARARRAGALAGDGEGGMGRESSMTNTPAQSRRRKAKGAEGKGRGRSLSISRSGSWPSGAARRDPSFSLAAREMEQLNVRYNDDEVSHFSSFVMPSRSRPRQLSDAYAALSFEINDRDLWLIISILD